MRLLSLVPIAIISSVSAIETHIVEVEFEVEKTADNDNLDNAKKQAIDDGKTKAIEYVCEKYDFKKTNLSTTYIDDCIDSYSIKSEKFIDEKTYKATIAYKVDIQRLQGYINSSKLAKSAADEANTAGYLLEENYPIAVINMSNLQGGFSKLANIMGAAFYDNLYAITSDSLKLYATDEIKRILNYNHFSFYIEYSK